MNLYADMRDMCQLVRAVRDELDAVESVLLTAVSPEGATELRKILERVNGTVDYDPGRDGTLFAWAVETIGYLESERKRHGDQVSEIHRLVTAAGHSCSRGQLGEKVAEILVSK